MPALLSNWGCAMHYAANTLENHWMPFTTNRDFKADPRLMVKAQGLYYWNHKGEKLVDASSGLFCCAAGHGRSEIVDAVTAQMSELDYTPHFQTGHPSSFELARMVAKITPGDLNYVFFCNSGSEAVESAIKIALAYHVANGEGQRTRFVSRERAYHGVNICGIPGCRKTASASVSRPPAPSWPMICSVSSTCMGHARLPPVSWNRSPARPVFSFRPRAICSDCARSATKMASCWCLTK